MGEITQEWPPTTVSTLDGLTLRGSYARDPLDPFVRIDRVELYLNAHQTNHTGETPIWHYLGPIPAPGPSEDSFEITLPELGLQSGVSYCWKVRVRDVKGNWFPSSSTWTQHATDSVWSLSAAAPVLSMVWPIQPDSTDWPIVSATISLPTMAGVRFSAAYSDAVSSPPGEVHVQLVEQVAAEDWEDGDYGATKLLWYTGGKHNGQRPTDRVTVRYSGRQLRGDKTYLWRIWVKNMYGVSSNIVGGKFFLQDSTIVIPGDISTERDAWRMIWETDEIALPVGVWYDPADSANIRVIDRATKRLCVLRQSDRALISSDLISGITSYPVGLSGDPGDPTNYYWVLAAPWVSGAGLGGNYIKKVNRSAHTVAASYALASGRWTAIKVSAAYIWATNWDTGLIYKINKSTGATISSHTITYDGVVQTKPTGIMVDGTTLYYFFYNDGTTKRFLVASEAAPETITRVIDTGGTAILGGEMDTTTHTEMYGDSDSLGLVWKFTMTEPVLIDGGNAGRWLPALTTYADA